MFLLFQGGIFRFQLFVFGGVSSRKLTWQAGKSPFLIGDTSSKGPCSIAIAAMLVYRSAFGMVTILCFSRTTNVVKVFYVELQHKIFRTTISRSYYISIGVFSE